MHNIINVFGFPTKTELKIFKWFEGNMEQKTLSLTFFQILKSAPTNIGKMAERIDPVQYTIKGVMVLTINRELRHRWAAHHHIVCNTPLKVSSYQELKTEMSCKSQHCLQYTIRGVIMSGTQTQMSCKSQHCLQYTIKSVMVLTIPRQFTWLIKDALPIIVFVSLNNN